jgi:hypothetical protein
MFIAKEKSEKKIQMQKNCTSSTARRFRPPIFNSNEARLTSASQSGCNAFAVQRLGRLRKIDRYCKAAPCTEPHSPETLLENVAASLLQNREARNENPGNATG